METKEIRKFEKERGRAMEKKKNDKRTTHRKPSPPPLKLGNIQKVKGFCSHCAPTNLIKRIEQKQDITNQMKDFENLS